MKTVSGRLSRRVNSNPTLCSILFEGGDTRIKVIKEWNFEMALEM